ERGDEDALVALGDHAGATPGHEIALGGLHRVVGGDDADGPGIGALDRRQRGQRPLLAYRAGHGADDGGIDPAALDVHGAAAWKAHLERLVVGDAERREARRPAAQHLLGVLVHRRLHAASGDRPGDLPGVRDGHRGAGLPGRRALGLDDGRDRGFASLRDPALKGVEDVPHAPPRCFGKKFVADATNFRCQSVAARAGPADYVSCRALRVRRRAGDRAPARVLPRRRGARGGGPPRARDAAPAPARGRARRREDRGGEDAGAHPRRRAHPPAVLRGHRLRSGALRVGLLTPVAVRPRAPGRRDRRGRAYPRALRAGVPPRAPAPAGGAKRRGRSAAGGRARPRRRRVRGLPARGALGLPGDHPGGGDHPRGDPAGRRHHLEPHPGAARRAEAPLPVPLDRLPGPGAGDRDHPAPGRRRGRGARAVRRGGDRPHPDDGPAQAPGPRGGDRLGPRARPARRPPGGRDVGAPDPGVGRQEPRRPAHGRVRDRGDRRGMTSGGPRDGRPETAPLEVLAGFGRALRAAGLVVGTDRLMAYCQGAALAAGDDLYWVGVATLVGRREDLPTYNRVFREHFLGAPGPPPVRERPRTTLLQALPLGLKDGDGPQAPELEAAVASAEEILRRKSFSGCTDDELRELARLMARLRVEAPMRLTRRRAAGPPRGGRTRRSFRTGGEPVERAWRARRRKRRRIVFLLDVSGSMSAYSRALAIFAHAALRTDTRFEVFSFGTRLTRLTPAL